MQREFVSDLKPQLAVPISIIWNALLITKAQDLSWDYATKKCAKEKNMLGMKAEIDEVKHVKNGSD